MQRPMLMTGLLLPVLLALVSVGCASQTVPPPPSPVQEEKPTPSKEPATPEPLPPLPNSPCLPANSAVDPSQPPHYGTALRPPEPAGTAAYPWLMQIRVPIGHMVMLDKTDQPRLESPETAYAHLTRPGTAVVGTESFQLSGGLDPDPAADWYATHMVLEGVEAVRTQLAGGFYLDIPPGKPGDTFRLTFRDVRLADGTLGDFSATFCRQERPRATLAYRSEGNWTPASQYVRADGPLALRLAFTAPMNRETVQKALQLSAGTGAIQALNWVDDRTLEFTAAQPEALVRVNIMGAQGPNGLYANGDLPYLYTGQPAHLVAVDPVTGAEERIGPVLPPEIGVAGLSPDGQRVRFTAIERRMGQTDPVASTHRWELDLPGGELREVDRTGNDWPWIQFADKWPDVRYEESRLVFNLTGPDGGNRMLTEGKELPDFWSYHFSPDGSRLALYLPAEDPTVTDPYLPVRLVVVDLATLSRKEIPGVIRWFAPGKDGIQIYGPIWSLDSRRIVINQDLENGVAIVVADLEEGTLRTVATNVDGVGRGWSSPITWTPDSSRLLIGPVLLDLQTGAVLRRLEGIRGDVLFGPDEERLLYPAHGWDAVTAVNLTTGQPVSLGEGRPVGWLPDGRALIIRWPDAAVRFQSI